MPRVYEGAKGLIVRMRGLAAGMERYQLAASASIAVDLTAEERRIIDSEIYSVPEKVGPSGRKLWARKGTLRNEERAVVDGQRVVFRGAAHALPRHDMNPTPPQRVVRFRSQAMANRRRQTLEIRRRFSLRALEGS